MLERRSIDFNLRASANDEDTSISIAVFPTKYSLNQNLVPHWPCQTHCLFRLSRNVDEVCPGIRKHDSGGASAI